MTPVGNEFATNADPAIVAFMTPWAGRSIPRNPCSSRGAAQTIYRQQRASRKIGDVVTAGQYRDQRPGHPGQHHGRSTTATPALAQSDWSLKYCHLGLDEKKKTT